MKVKLATALPRDETELNGLDVLHDALTRRPADHHILVVLVDCAKTEIDHASNSKTPTVQIRHVEAMTGQEAVECQRLLAKAQRNRISPSRPVTGGLFGDEVERTSKMLAEPEDGAN